MKRFFQFCLIIIILVGVYNVFKPLPEGLGYASPLYVVPDTAVTFLVDRTYIDSTGVQQFEHEIFDRMLENIRTADSYILADLFLFNNQLGQAGFARRGLSDELAKAIVERSAGTPGLQVFVVTDPINSAYGSYLPSSLALLTGANIPLVTTDLTVLRDSNPLYSALWRTVLQYIPDIGGQWLQNPFDPNHEESTISAFLRAFNFKANHRKLLLTNHQVGDTQEWRTMVMSMNPHDGSSRHSNVGVMITNALAADVQQSEQVVIKFSSDIDSMPRELITRDETVLGSSTLEVQLLTEQAIKDQVIRTIDALRSGDMIKLAMFYISDRDIVSALKAADERGVISQILLDPNKDAFGREKKGIPNRQVAHELIASSAGNTSIRWCKTSGEQCHSKLLITKSGERLEVVLGSANFTRRNLDNYNLETDIRLIGTASTTAIAKADTFFDDQWSNRDGKEYSVPYEIYADISLPKQIWYHLGEFTGMSHY